MQSPESLVVRTVPRLEAGRVSPIDGATLRSLGERPSAVDTLLEHALYSQQIDDDRYLSVVPKVRPYASVYDAMIVVADEHQVIPSIAAFPDDQLQKQLQLADLLFTAYAAFPDQTQDPIAFRGIALNYDAWASDADLLPKPAQTIRTEHMHVFANTQSELQSLQTVSIASLPVKEQRRFADPMAPYVDALLQLQSIRSFLLGGIETLQFSKHPEYEGITFQYEGDITDKQFARDLQQLHANGEALFHHISGFLNPEMLDTAGQPVLKPQTQREIALRYFLESFLPTGSDEVTYHRQIKRQSEWMMQNIRASHAHHVIGSHRMHEEYAYTLAILQPTDVSSWTVAFAPRIVSDGNVLTMLRQHRIPSESLATDKDYEAISRFTNYIRQFLAQNK